MIFVQRSDIILAMPSQRPTIYNRLISLIKASGYKGSLREWCTDTGLSEGYISNLRDRCAKNPKATIRGDAATLIARALGISTSELLDEQPEASSTSSRDAAVRAARELGYSAEAIAAATSGEPLRDDPGVLWYFRRIEAEEDRIKRNRPSASMRSL